MIKIDKKYKTSIDFLTNNIRSNLNIDQYKSIPKPHVVVIRIINDQVSNFYIEKNKKICEELGIRYQIYDYNPSVTTDHLKKVISELSLNPLVTGISIQGVIPSHINERKLIDEIDPIKDIDGITPVQRGLLLHSEESDNILVSPMVQAIYDCIFFNFDSNFDSVSIIDSDKFIGRSLILYTEERGHIVIGCNSENEKSLEFTNNSDIVVLLSDKPNYFKSRYFYGKSNKLIIDASLIYDCDNQKLCGSLDINDVETQNSISDTFKYTTVLDGLGDLAALYTAWNIHKAYASQFDFIWKYCNNRNLLTF